MRACPGQDLLNFMQEEPIKFLKSAWPLTRSLLVVARSWHLRMSSELWCQDWANRSSKCLDATASDECYVHVR